MNDVRLVNVGLAAGALAFSPTWGEAAIGLGVAAVICCWNWRSDGHVA